MLHKYFSLHRYKITKYKLPCDRELRRDGGEAKMCEDGEGKGGVKRSVSEFQSELGYD